MRSRIQPNAAVRRPQALQPETRVKKKPSRAPRPQLPRISEEMKAWSAALASEVETWPQVSARPMFGFTALYRRNRIFAALPKTRGMESPNALAFKLDAPSSGIRARLASDCRIGSTDLSKACWLTFELSSHYDLRAALDWLGLAYEAAR